MGEKFVAGDFAGTAHRATSWREYAETHMISREPGTITPKTMWDYGIWLTNVSNVGNSLSNYLSVVLLYQMMSRHGLLRPGGFRENSRIRT